MKKTTRRTSNKGKSVVGIFAHPDDEAFSVAGTLAKFAKTRDVYIVCVTDGNDKTNRRKNLASIRKREMRESANAIGAKEVFFLDYEDGELSNNLYHEVAGKIEKLMRKIRPEIIITLEHKGISGHIDHIFVSMVATYVFNKLDFVKKLYFACITNKIRKELGNEYFIYVPDGYRDEDIDLTVDITKYWDSKIKALKAHKSQINVERAVEKFKLNIKKEHFLVKSK